MDKRGFLLRFSGAALLGLSPGGGGVAAWAQPEGAGQSAQDLLKGAQAWILNAQYEAARGNDSAPLEAIAARLKHLNVGLDRAMAYYLGYWRAYVDYQIALIAISNKKRDLAKTSLAEAIQILEGVEPKDAEFYALRSLIFGLNLSFASMLDIIGAIGKAGDDLHRAQAAAPMGLRVLYASAVADHATPANYGGGKKAEGYLNTALALRPEPLRPLRPTWGQDNCAALLIKIMLESGRRPQAADLFSRYRMQFPNSGPLVVIERRL